VSTRPKVTQVVLYKHGVAFLERRGPADGEFELSFRRGDMNDVLKSLAVVVASGTATVGAVAYDAPANPDVELASRNLLLEPGEALPGLLNAVRGRVVELSVDGRTHRGEVIGIDEVDAGNDGNRRSLVLRTDGGSIAIFDLATVKALELVEDPSREDLEYLIDRSRAATAGENRTVRVQVNGWADELLVSYVVPAPIWRVSYRLVCEADSITLLAMGIVHNPVDEDLEDVQLTLSTGQPVSFDIDLYQPKRLQRALVEETERAGHAPTRHAAGYGALPAAGGYDTVEGAMPMPAARAAAPFLGAADALVGSYDEDLSDAADRGEHFEYRVAEPISLKRGMASMVPLIVKRVEGARKERIWKDGTPPAPDIVLTFDNTSGAVLEEGPAVVYDDGTYAGEAMVPYTSRGTPVRLAFAKDLSVRCSRTSSSSSVSTRVVLGDDALIDEQRLDITHVLRAENDGDESVDVIFELSKRDATTLRSDGELLQPFEETSHRRRFRLTAPPHDAVEAHVGESRLISHSVRYISLTPDQLQRWLQQRLLDEVTFGELARVLAHWEQAQRLEQHCARLEDERSEAYAGQGRITEQLNVLREGGPEGAVRQRNVQQLVALQDRAAALDAEIYRGRETIEAERRAATAELRDLVQRRGQTGIS
jgi:hypothetical protein